jgi:hypothetical protein
MTANHGWFQHQLWTIESALWGRWAYWMAMGLNRTVGPLPEWAIPQIPFAVPSGVHQPPAELRAKLPADMLEKIGTPDAARKHAIKIICERCRYYGAHLIDIVRWWLWAFGSWSVEQRPSLPDEAQIILYHEFELHRLLGNPADWGAEITAEWMNGAKKGTAWFPTPLCLVMAMTAMTFGMEPSDGRLLKVQDPCVGTGAFLLGASNYSLRLSCCDIDPLMCAWTEFAGWLFIPWLVRPQYIKELREDGATSVGAKAEPAPSAPPAIAPLIAKPTRRRKQRLETPSLFAEVK